MKQWLVLLLVINFVLLDSWTALYGSSTRSRLCTAFAHSTQKYPQGREIWNSYASWRSSYRYFRGKLIHFNVLCLNQKWTMATFRSCLTCHCTTCITIWWAWWRRRRQSFCCWGQRCWMRAIECRSLIATQRDWRRTRRCMCCGISFDSWLEAY